MSQIHVTAPLSVLSTCYVTEGLYLLLHSVTPQSEMCHQMLRKQEYSHLGASGAAAPRPRAAESKGQQRGQPNEH